MGSSMLCTTCGTLAVSKRYTKGSFGLEVLLWLMFLVPGILYSLWRLASRYEGCPACGSSTLVPPDSPIARKMATELRQAPLPPSLQPWETEPPGLKRRARVGTIAAMVGTPACLVSSFAGDWATFLVSIGSLLVLGGASLFVLSKMRELFLRRLEREHRNS